MPDFPPFESTKETSRQEIGTIEFFGMPMERIYIDLSVDDTALLEAQAAQVGETIESFASRLLIEELDKLTKKDSKAP